MKYNPITRYARSLILLFIALLSIKYASGQSAQTGRQMTAAAGEFISTLTPALKTQSMLSFSSPERTRWSNEPSYMFKRAGITLGELNDTQKMALQALVRTGLSSQGYLKAMNTIRLDDLLHAEGVRKGEKTADSYGSGNYWVVFFGTPGSSQWSWRFEGHHLSLNFTFSNGEISTTPFFLGVNPATIPSGPYAGFRYMQDETDGAWKLIESLNKKQLSETVVSDHLPEGRDILTRTGKEPHLKNIVGISYTALNATQQTLLKQIIGDYVNNLTPVLAKEKWNELEKTGWDHFHFSWRGGTKPGTPVYYAIQAPGFIIEYVSRLGDASHIHSVMRDLKNDFGEDFTRQ